MSVAGKASTIASSSGLAPTPQLRRLEYLMIYKGGTRHECDTDRPEVRLMNRYERCTSAPGAVDAGVGGVVLGADAQAAPAACNLRLRGGFPPDVPGPVDARFLNSLVSARIRYPLAVAWQEPQSVSLFTIDLTG